MKRFSVLLASFVLVAGIIVGCADSNTSPSSASEPAASSVSTMQASSGGGFSFVSSDSASSDSVSSDSASSDSASSDSASSNRSADPVLSGPSGLAQMNVPMHFISDKDVIAIIESGDSQKIIIDLRKPEDVKGGHIQGAIFAPMNKAVDNNNYADAIANLTGALYDATGNEVGEGKELVLVCYAGKKYAQAATDILNALGADMDRVYTLEGGMTAWNEAGNPTVTD